MFHFLLFILFIYFPVALNAQNCSNDQINAVKTCYLTYLKGYGFDVIPTYNYYDNAEDKYRVRGWNGEVYICNAGTKLIQCIGSNNDGCVNVDTMTKISGLTDDSPIQYVIDYRSMKYKCFGQGFTEFKDTYQCLQKLHECPGNSATCDEVVPYVKCMEDTAFKLCGSEARDFVCNLYDTIIDVYLNCPTLPKCSRNQTEPYHRQPSRFAPQLFV